jgi:hypothetical protein
MVYDKLINHIKKLQKTYNINTHSYDSHFDDYIKDKNVKFQFRLLILINLFLLRQFIME